jgi:hypothetical protein
MKRLSLLIAAATIAIVVAQAQEQPAQPQQAQQELSLYCRSGAAALSKISLEPASVDAAYAAVRQKCRPGDTIAIQVAGAPTYAQASVPEIGRLCDFSKAIVTAGASIICVLVGERGVR